MFDKEEREIFGNPTIPFRIIIKGKKEAIYDITNNKYLTNFGEYHYGVWKSSNEEKFYNQTGGKILILNASRGKSFLILDNKVTHTVNNAEFNFFSMDPNTDYICISEREEHLEYIFDIKNKKQVTPKFRAIFPTPSFPKLALYKARNNHKESIFSFPDNKQLIPWFNDISSVGLGVLGGKNNYYYTVDENHEIKYWKKWNIPILHELPENIVKKIFNELKINNLTNHTLIKRVFKIKL